jgi:hypothetical protein
MIWQHALVNPRQALGGICTIPNFDLSHPQIILPRPREFEYLYGQDNGPRVGMEPQDIKKLVKVAKDRLHDVISLMHTNRESRHVALRIYRLDCKSLLPEENIAW